MKVSRPKDERQREAVERGLAAERIQGDALIAAWFKETEAGFVRDMLGAEIADDQKRRESAVKIQLLRQLKNHIDTTVTLGRNAAKQLERAKTDAA